jgi:hypothetical protein
MECTICSKFTKVEGACVKCRMRIESHLIELPALHHESSDFIAPGKSGNGSISSERSIGVNVSALDFSMATELLAILHGWESIIRTDRNLQPPALLPKLPTTEAEVRATCDFHIAHLDWSLSQSWAFDFVGEVAGLHAKGMAAAKRFKEQPRRIPCPTDNCTRFVIVDAEELMGEVSCYGCKESWTVIRLVALAMSNPAKKFFLDVEAIALWIGISERQVYKIIKENKIERNGSLYDLAGVIRARG